MKAAVNVKRGPVHPVGGVGSKRDEVLIHGVTGWAYAKWKKPDTKGHVVSDSTYVKCPESTDGEGGGGCLGRGLGRNGE